MGKYKVRKPPTPPPPPAPSTDYTSTLVNGRTPATLTWKGRTWRANMGSTWNNNLDYCLRLTTNKARFELHDNSYEHIEGEADTKRRTELSTSLPGDFPGEDRLPNGVSLWGAFSFNHHSWSDPVGMLTKEGGVYGQIHEQTFGGSPILAFRRRNDRQFRITTRGANDTDNHTRYLAPLSFDQVYDLVYQVTIHPTAGALKVWIDKVKVVDLSNISIGAASADSVMIFGAYFGDGGITCPVVAEYANFVYPTTSTLISRTTSTPAWPAD